MLPSGENAGSPSRPGLVVSWRTPLPSALMVWTSWSPSRLLQNASSRPFGDQTGRRSPNRLAVSCRWSVPSALIVKISLSPPPLLLNAILPSRPGNAASASPTERPRPTAAAAATAAAATLRAVDDLGIRAS